MTYFIKVLAFALFVVSCCQATEPEPEGDITILDEATEPEPEITILDHSDHSDCSCKTDPNTHLVEHTDACGSRCQYYGQVCPIQTFAATQPGYDCNWGYCRLPGLTKCIQVPRNAKYAEHKDACQSLCQYSGQICPIRTFVATQPGFNCIAGYCRITPESQCTRSICNKREF